MIRTKELFLQKAEGDHSEDFIHQHNDDSLQHREFINAVNLDILPTKGNVKTIAQNIADAISAGYLDPLETLARLEAIKGVCELARELTSETVRTELEKYGKEEVIKLSAKFELAEVGVSYDYSPDPLWSRLKAEVTPLISEMKCREKLLKTLKRTMVETDGETGETFEVPPPIRTSTSSFKITLGK